MSRGTWSIDYKSGVSWVSDGTIYRPNTDFPLLTLGTQSKLRLADGSSVFMTPETKFLPEAVQFMWLELAYTDALINKIKTYVQNQTYLRITTHQSDILYGKFISISRVWLVAQSPDEMDIQASFDRISESS